MNHEEYMDIRGLMAQRGTRAGENKRIPVTLVSKAAADHLSEVEIRLRKVQIATPFVLCFLGLLIGIML
jgi:hypothetical protein